MFTKPRRLAALGLAAGLLFGLTGLQPALADTSPTPQAPVLSIIAKNETLPFTVAGNGPIEVAVLTGGAAPSTATWSERTALPLNDYAGSTIRVLARSKGATDQSSWFDATYDVRDTYSPGSKLGSPENPEDNTPVPSDKILAWPSEVANYTPGTDVTPGFQTPESVIGKLGLVVLGNGGQITLKFAQPIADGAGPDFTVAENGFRINGTTAMDFLEFGKVSVSSDGVNFAEFDSAAQWPNPVGAFAGLPATTVGQLAGKDLSGYGTNFDLTALTNKPEVRSGKVDLDRITHVRIIDVIGDGNDLDSFGRPIYDPHKTVGSGGFDLTGIGALNLAPTQPAGPCKPNTGVTVVVDFGSEAPAGQDQVVTGCAYGEQEDGFDALKNAGFAVNEDAPGAFPGTLCTVDGIPTQGYPYCWTTGYWSYWLGESGKPWKYSNLGAGNRKPPVGSVEGWRWVLLDEPGAPPKTGPSFTEGEDTTAPILTLSPPPATTPETTVTVTIGVDDLAATLTCQLDDAAAAPCPAPTGWDGSQRAWEVTGLKPGPHTMKVTATDTWGNESSKSVTFTVEAAKVPVTGITLPASITLDEGRSQTLTPTITPSNATNQGVTWSSSNKAIATVDTTGKVTAVKAGTATITATAVDGSGAKASTKVAVTAPAPIKVKGITLPASITLDEGRSQTLTPTITPSNATNQGVTWASSNKAIATVDATGKVTAVKAGTATITATAVDGSGVKASTKVSVTAKPFDVYTTPGTHNYNGRVWRTTCEPYSQTERCRTEIQATTITYANGVFTSKTGWAFNNLTYKASKRALWNSNPLGAYGKVGGKVSWTAEDGRKWRTECDTAGSGRNGCRSFATVDVIESYLDATGNRKYRWVKKESFNNIVRFS